MDRRYVTAPHLDSTEGGLNRSMQHLLFHPIDQEMSQTTRN